jgi:hypothetical protein
MIAGSAYPYCPKRSSARKKSEGAMLLVKPSTTIQKLLLGMVPCQTGTHPPLAGSTGVD